MRSKHTKRPKKTLDIWNQKQYVFLSTQVGVWRSLAARLFWVQEVGGSNPLTPTILIKKQSSL